MKHLLATTALAALLATPLMADTHGSMSGEIFRDAAADTEIRASNFIGARVYVSETDLTDEMTDIDENWDDIGEINDVLMTRDGEIEAILVDVGGFLGIGEKTVAVDMDSLRLVSDGEDANEYFVVFTANREQLESAPQFDKERGEMTEEKAEEKTDAAMEKTDDAATTAVTADSTTVERSDDTMAEARYPNAPEIEREGYETRMVTDLTTEDLTGAAVYDANDEWIGEVSKLILDDGGQVTQAVIDVGGFLGMGEKPVALKFESLTIKQEVDGDDLRVYLDATEAQLEAMPEYEES